MGFRNITSTERSGMGYIFVARTSTIGRIEGLDAVPGGTMRSCGETFANIVAAGDINPANRRIIFGPCLVVWCAVKCKPFVVGRILDPYCCL